MKRILFILIGAFFFCIQMVGQDRQRYYTVTTKKGAYNPDNPKPESKRYKIKRFPGSEIEYKLFFQEYNKGVQVEHAADKNWALFLHQTFSKNDSVIIEMIPELANSDQIFKVHFMIPAGRKTAPKRTKTEGKCLRYVLFKSFDVISDASSSPVLLVYEDDKSTNKNEAFIRKNLKNGLLPNTKKMMETIRQHIENYNLLYYTTNKKE